MSDKKQLAINLYLWFEPDLNAPYEFEKWEGLVDTLMDKFQCPANSLLAVFDRAHEILGKMENGWETPLLPSMLSMMIDCTTFEELEQFVPIRKDQVHECSVQDASSSPSP